MELVLVLCSHLLHASSGAKIIPHVRAHLEPLKQWRSDVLAGPEVDDALVQSISKVVNAVS